MQVHAESCSSQHTQKSMDGLRLVQEGMVFHKQVFYASQQIGAVRENFGLRSLNVELQEIHRPVQVVSQSDSSHQVARVVPGPGQSPGPRAFADKTQGCVSRP